MKIEFVRRLKFVSFLCKIRTEPQHPGQARHPLGGANCESKMQPNLSDIILQGSPGSVSCAVFEDTSLFNIIANPLYFKSSHVKTLSLFSLAPDHWGTPPTSDTQRLIYNCQCLSLNCCGLSCQQWSQVSFREGGTINTPRPLFLGVLSLLSTYSCCAKSATCFASSFSSSGTLRQ